MKQEQTEITILTLSYERQISRAHTIFSSFWDIFFGIMVGFLGLILGMYQIKAFDFNPFNFTAIIIVLFLVILVAGVVAYYNWFMSTIERKKIIEKIKALATQPNKS